MAKFDIDVNVSGEERAKKLKNTISSLDKAQESLQKRNFSLKKQIFNLDKADANYAKTKAELTQKISKNSLAIQKNNSNLKKHKNNLAQVSEQNKKATNTTRGLKTAVGALATVATAKKIVEYADSWKLTNSRLKLVTTSTENLTNVEEALFKTSQQTRQEYGATADLYARIAKASSEMGTSQNDLLKVTKAVNQAMIVSGATTQEASSVITQLSQGLASGVLRGEEFNSIMEGGSRVADALADSLGVARGDLRAMAEQGELTSEVVMQALIEQSQKIDSEFNQMGTTVGQTSQVIENAFQKAIGTIDKATGTTDTLGDTMKTAFYGASVVVTSLTNAFDSMGARIAGIAFRLENGIFLSDEESKALEKMYDSTKKNIKAREDALDVLKKELEAKDKTTAKIKEDTKSTKKNTEVKEDSLEVMMMAFESEIALLDESYERKEKYRKKEEEELQKENNAYAKKVENLREVRSAILELTGDDTEIFYDNLSNKIAELGDKGATSSEQLEYFNLSLSNFENTKSIEALEETSNSFTSILDSQISLAESTQNWTDSLEGNSKAIAGVGKSFQKMHVNNLKAQKEDYNLQKKYAVDFKKANGDKEKIKKLDLKFEKDKAKLDNQNSQNRLNDIGAIAGAVAQATEEGSTAHKVAQGIQLASAMVSGVLAVIQAGTNGDPYTAVARMATMAATVSGYLSQVGGGSVSGSGAPLSVGDVQGSSAGFAFEGMEDTSKSLENALKDLKSSVDVQNKLFGASGLYGTEFINDLKVSFGTLVSDVATAWQDSFNNATALDFQGLLASFDLESLTLKSGFGLNATTLQYDNIFQLFGAMSDLSETLPDLEKFGRGGNLTALADFETAVNEAINSYTSSMLDMADTMDGYRETWKDIYDEVKQNGKYANLALEKATIEIEDLSTALGVDTFDELLEELINKYDIDYATLQDMYDANDPAKLAEYLSEIFPQGKFSPEEIYNYVDAIESVGEAMGTSASNIRSFEDSLKSQQQLLEEQAKSFSLEVATTRTELREQLEVLKKGTGGLTSKESDYLHTARKAIDEKNKQEQNLFKDQQRQAKKLAEDKRKKAEKEAKKAQEEAERFAKEHAKNELRRAKERQKAFEEAEKARIKAIQDGLKTTLRAIETSIGITTNSIDKMQSVAERLRESSLGSTNTLNNFYESMSATIGLSKTGDYAKFSESLDKTIGYSSILDDLTAFDSKQDQDFARLVASKQFEDMTGVMEDELSYLKKIEANTRTKLLESGAKGFSRNIKNNQVTGAIRSHEYINNAQTRKDSLENNENIFSSEMVNSLNVIKAHLFEINKVSKRQLTIQTDSNYILQDKEA